mgnify:CR=1 FL=1
MIVYSPPSVGVQGLEISVSPHLKTTSSFVFAVFTLKVICSPKSISVGEAEKEVSLGTGYSYIELKFDRTYEIWGNI